MDKQKLLLDQFFGVDRNLPRSERNKKKEHYSDKEVCIHYLISLDQCYKGLFPNTAYDDGPCPQRHDEFFKRQFEDDAEERRAEHEYIMIKQVIDYIQKKVDDVDNKIVKNRTVTEKKPSEIERPKEIQDKIDYYENNINLLLEQSKALGAQGEIEQSERLSDQAESMRLLKENTISSHDNGPANNSLAQKEVCEVCGAWKVNNDNDKRAQMHLEGKIHQGFQLFRTELVRLKDRKNHLKTVLKKLEKDKPKKSRSRSNDKKRSRSPQVGKLRDYATRNDRGDRDQRGDRGDRGDRQERRRSNSPGLRGGRDYGRDNARDHGRDGGHGRDNGRDYGRDSGRGGDYSRDRGNGRDFGQDSLRGNPNNNDSLRGDRRPMRR